MSAPRVLVLASRQALEVMGPAADRALDAIGAERAGMSDLGDALSMFEGVDVVLADVTRPSPAISFELGVAAAQSVPTVFVASDLTRVSPVFTPVVGYDGDESPARIGYRFARHLEDALHSMSSRTRKTQPSGEPSAVVKTPVDMSRQPANYQRGEIVEGPVVHIDTDAGFALLRSGERRPAMLHISRMSPSLASAFEDDELSVGDTIRAEVVEVDESRDQVQLRDIAGDTKPRSEEDSSDLIATLLRRWAGLEKVMGPGLRTRPDPAGPEGAYQRFINVYEKELSRARKVRNSAAHGESPSEAELRDAIDILDELRRVLRADS